MSKKCQLISVDELHDPITLEENNPLIIGRSRETKIKDLRCSKKQCKLTNIELASLKLI